MKQTITWKNVEVLISKIKPTPNNYKLKTEDGTARFKTSVKDYGLAGAVILNADYTLIDGNTRVEEAKEQKLKKVWASMPSRKLTPKEFTEFSAMYDMARAGEVDITRIKDELGTTEAFFKKWNMPIPMEAQKTLEALTESDKTVVAGKKAATKEAAIIPLRQIQLMFTTQEADLYIKTGESLYSKYKVDNITDLSMKLMLQAKKLK